MISFRIVAAPLFVLAAACGAAATEPATPPTGSAAPAASSAPSASSAPPAASASPAAGPAWKDDMSKDEKVAFMKTNVSPRMAKVFKAYDATKYAEFNCKTCHGPAFKEPKEFLAKLVFKDGRMTSPADKSEVAKFMHEKVVPEMAAAMGMKPFDMQTKTGFGCGGCHAIEMK